ncbi:hypothetical protein [Actinomadura bangladeshensis]|uniref:hypothetical protein n=1 Tax=Actinomadura bangladeshensis TaxID=453573 RepID=UPI003C7ACE77
MASTCSGLVEGHCASGCQWARAGPVGSRALLGLGGCDAGAGGVRLGPHWSPVTDSLMKLKLRSRPGIDLAENSGRAIAIEDRRVRAGIRLRERAQLPRR